MRAGDCQLRGPRPPPLRYKNSLLSQIWVFSKIQAGILDDCTTLVFKREFSSSQFKQARNSRKLHHLCCSKECCSQFKHAHNSRKLHHLCCSKGCCSQFKHAMAPTGAAHNSSKNWRQWVIHIDYGSELGLLYMHAKHVPVININRRVKKLVPCDGLS